MDEKQLQTHLSGLNLGTICYLTETDSTNDVALQMLEQGAPDASLVAAGWQKQGRGRLDRIWYSVPEHSLTFSMLFTDLSLEPSKINLLAPFAGMAVTLALEENLRLSPEIKWPNDVLLDGKKVAGILVDSVWEGDRHKGVVIGVGVNVATMSVPPEESQMFPSGSVEFAAGSKVDRWELLRWIITKMQREKGNIGSETFMAGWERRLAYKNQPVRISTLTDSPIMGHVLGINPVGSLRIELDDGTTRDVEAGDVSLRPATGF